jgi:uncharacterized membrane protein YecN with MAPEG domain
MPITALYASLLTPLFLVLSIRVIRARRGAKVTVGDGGNAMLVRRMRVHANFAEYVPLALVLMLLAESLATSPWLLHALGIALVAGRLAHAYGVSQVREDFRFRVTGMVITFWMLGVASLACLWGAIARAVG